MQVRSLSVLAAASLVLVGLGTAPAASDDGAPGPARGSAAVSDAVSKAVPRTVLMAAPGAARTIVGASAAPQRTAQARAATVRVEYSGFTRAARRAFQRAVNTWAARVTSSVPITVRARFRSLATGVLGSAGPSFIWRDFPRAPQRNTWYVDAIANKHFGRQLDSQPDVLANFNRDRNDWYFGADGNPPTGRYDFETVVLHELGHGLGFLGAGNVSGSRGTVRLDGTPFGYDRFTETRRDTSLLRFADNSTALGDQLRSNRVYFDSARVRRATGGARARLYAPASWQPGSSYSHLNESTYRPGNANSLMTPFLRSAEAIHVPGPIVSGVFQNIGW